jgi:hypothetical protein
VFDKKKRETAKVSDKGKVVRIEIRVSQW